MQILSNLWILADIEERCLGVGPRLTISFRVWSFSSCLLTPTAVKPACSPKMLVQIPRRSSNMDITKCWGFFSPFELLCCFSAAGLGCCLIVGSVSSAFSFAISNWKAWSNGFRWLAQPVKISHFFALRIPWVAIVVCFGSVSICTVKCHPIRFCSKRLSLNQKV